MNALRAILKILGLLVKLITWIIINAIPFLRGLIEEWKKAKKK